LFLHRSRSRAGSGEARLPLPLRLEGGRRVSRPSSPNLRNSLFRIPLTASPYFFLPYTPKDSPPHTLRITYRERKISPLFLPFQLLLRPGTLRPPSSVRCPGPESSSPEFKKRLTNPRWIPDCFRAAHDSSFDEPASLVCLSTSARCSRHWHEPRSATRRTHTRASLLSQLRPSTFFACDGRTSPLFSPQSSYDNERIFLLCFSSYLMNPFFWRNKLRAARFRQDNPRLHPTFLLLSESVFWPLPPLSTACVFCTVVGPLPPPCKQTSSFPLLTLDLTLCNSYVCLAVSLTLLATEHKHLYKR